MGGRGGEGQVQLMTGTRVGMKGGGARPGPGPGLGWEGGGRARLGPGLGPRWEGMAGPGPAKDQDPGGREGEEEPGPTQDRGPGVGGSGWL